MKTHDLSFLELVKDALTRVREVGVVEVKNKIDKKEKFDIIGNTNSEVKKYILSIKEKKL